MLYSTIREKIIIETSRSDDMHAIRDLLAACDLPYQDIADEHLDHFMLARDDDQIIGVVGLEVYGKFALLRSLAVVPNYRARGLGARLVANAEENARALGVEHLILLTTTAEQFFHARGYERLDRNAAPPAIQATTEFRDICPSSAVCMTKDIGAKIRMEQRAE